ncbi:hypothetical protein LB553_01190 [Mesorhizobium sp. CA8]|uniref:hypothetical protein n=1 Tax=Mesorhizobium sp. CA8 TaxID=2876637 RepID=UPI001CCFA760|nr:hypothetical protein [Mesorhizobium sp. CA8]MBZ9759501.1 hypothetical protein [Mesorhizobium sp. CA8]
MSGAKDLITGVGIIRLPGYGTPSPEVPEASPIQTTLPTSAYGQTIPVVWGKARVPGAYIWVPPILTVTSTHTEWWDQITTTTSNMSCRLRFARPLVPNSTWTLRRLWSNGALIYDASQNYRKKGLNFRFYDGRSTQGRDPTMTKEEGTTNVSAHRGYIDIVIRDFDIQGFGAPPVFEAEVIQDGGSTVQTQNFLSFGGTVTQFLMAPVWDRQKLYCFDIGLAWYSIPAQRQYFFADVSTVGQVYFDSFRYSKALDRVVYLSAGTGVGPFRARMLDGSTGALMATSSVTADPTFCACLQDVTASKTLMVATAASGQFYCYQLNTSQAPTETVEQVYASGSGWNGYSTLQCVTPGGIVGGNAVFYLCADSDLVKISFTSEGLLASSSVIATLADPLRYAVFDDGDLVVWTDSATVSRVDGATGAIEYTKSVPYQIPDVAGRHLGAPDLHRLTEEFNFQTELTHGTSYFTDLGTGATRTVSGGLTVGSVYFYDGATNTLLAVNGASDIPMSIKFIAGDGDMRLLSDFLSDLMVYGGDFDPADVITENIDDLIQGAVIDITAGARDIARAVIEPYSIAMFER